MIALTDKEIEAVWNSLDGIALVTDRQPTEWSGILRKAFARKLIETVVLKLAEGAK